MFISSKLWIVLILCGLIVAIISSSIVFKSQLQFAIAKVPQFFAIAEVRLPDIPSPKPVQKASLPPLSTVLFGKLPQQPKKEVKKKIVETRLNLTLSGTFPSSQALEGRAVILVGGTEGVYKIGNVVLNDVKLIEVHDDHVILESANTKEILRFADENNTDSEPFFIDTQQLNFQVEEKAIENKKTKTITKAELKSYAESFNTSRQELLQELDLKELSKFYQVEKGSPLLAAGFLTGDQIVSVNGQPIKALLSNSRAVSAVISIGSIRVNVMRTKKRISLHYKLD